MSFYHQQKLDKPTQPDRMFESLDSGLSTYAEHTE
jgi:hypothetical protein